MHAARENAFSPHLHVPPHTTPPGVVYTHQYSSSLLRQHKVLAEARDLVMHELVEEMVVVYVMEAMIEEEEDEASQTIRARTASPQKWMTCVG